MYLLQTTLSDISTDEVVAMLHIPFPTTYVYLETTALPRPDTGVEGVFVVRRVWCAPFTRRGIEPRTPSSPRLKTRIHCYVAMRAAQEPLCRFNLTLVILFAEVTRLIRAGFSFIIGWGREHGARARTNPAAFPPPGTRHSLALPPCLRALF